LANIAGASGKSLKEGPAGGVAAALEAAGVGVEDVVMSDYSEMPGQQAELVAR